MQYLSIDFLILYAFLAITLLIGLRTGKGITSIREYATGNKMFGTGALILTWLATDICGQTVLDLPNFTRTDGIIIILPVIAWAISYLMQGFIFAPRFIHFPTCMTIGDVMGELYQGPAKIITGILAFLTAMCIMGMEMTVVGLLSETLLGIDFYWGVAVGGFILVLYTVHGGIKSVTYTDVFQFLILILIIPIITSIALRQAGGIQHVFTHIDVSNFAIFNHSKIGYYLAWFLSLSIFQFDIIDPALIQRILMAKTKQQLRDQFLIASAVLLAVMVTLVVLGLTSIVLFPDDTISSMVPHFIHHILPVGLKGVAFAGLFAVTMSTFDSFLHAAGLTLVHDVIVPIYNRTGKALNELRITRYITLIVGCVAIVVGLLRAENLYGFIEISYLFAGPLLAFPLFAGVLGLKPDKYALYIASLFTVVTLLLAKVLLPEEHQHMTNLIGVCINGIIFLGIHAIRHKGFAVINYAKSQSYIWRPQPQHWKDQLKKWLPTPKNILLYSRTRVEEYGAPYISLGVFGVITYVLPFYTWDHETVATYNLMIYIRVAGAMAFGMLIVKDQWSASLRPYFPIFWHLTLGFCFPFVNTVMLLLTDCSLEWLINISLGIMLLMMLVDWVTFFILTFLGIGLGLLFYTQFMGPIQIAMSFSSGYFLIYQGIFATAIGLIFGRRRHLSYHRHARPHTNRMFWAQGDEQTYLTKFKERIRFIHTLKKANVHQLPSIVKGIKALRHTICQSTAPTTSSWNHALQEYEDQLTFMAFSLTGMGYRGAYLRLDVASISIHQLLDQLQSHLPDWELRYLNQSKHQQIVCDATQLVTLLKNTVMTLPVNNNHDGQSPSYYLGIQDTVLEYAMPVVSKTNDYFKQIAAIRLTISQSENDIPDVCQSYRADMRSSLINNPNTDQELLLTRNQQILKAHYGYTNVDVRHSTTYDHYVYVLPVDLHEIRPVDMNNSVLKLGAELVRANDQYPGAVEQEKAFLEAVAENSSADMDKVKKALELIKWYHGSVHRKSGEPFYLHPLSVAQIVLDWHQDEATILGALLHDTVEDTSMMLDNINLMFGEEVEQIVNYATRFESFQDSVYKGKLTDKENIAMLMDTTERRALFVKVADRLHNMRTIEGHSSAAKKNELAKETLIFFVPLSMALGLDQAAEELKKASNRIILKYDKPSV